MAPQHKSCNRGPQKRISLETPTEGGHHDRTHCRHQDPGFQAHRTDETRRFLTSYQIPDEGVCRVWEGIALHTTPEIPYHMQPEVALVTAGVETDVLGIGYRDLEQSQIHAVVAAHPRPDFKRQILQAFTEGIKDRLATTFGNVKAHVLAHFVPGFVRGDFVETIKNSD
jgi:hypothetical protein